MVARVISVDLDTARWWCKWKRLRNTRLISGCGPNPEGGRGRNVRSRGVLSEDSCRSSKRVSITI